MHGEWLPHESPGDKQSRECLGEFAKTSHRRGSLGEPLKIKIKRNNARDNTQAQIVVDYVLVTKLRPF